jgi:hypothetical protein
LRKSGKRCYKVLSVVSKLQHSTSFLCSFSQILMEIAMKTSKTELLISFRLRMRTESPGEEFNRKKRRSMMRTQMLRS